MDTKWRNYSHSLATKIIVFLILMVCFTGAITEFVNMVSKAKIEYIDIVWEENYSQSKKYKWTVSSIMRDLITLLKDYKSEEYILSGKTIKEREFEREEESLFFEDFVRNSKSYNPNLSDEENREIFKEVYADKISQARDKLIQRDLREYKLNLERLEEYKGIIYYVSGGQYEFTNSSKKDKDYFKSFPSYMVVDQDEEKAYPVEFYKDRDYWWVKSNIRELDPNSTIYLALSDEFLNSQIKEWQEDKKIVTESLYKIGVFLLGLLLSFIYLIIVLGKKYFKDKEIHLNFIDKLYTDINLILCLMLIIFWMVIVDNMLWQNLYKIIAPLTFSIGTIGLILVLSLIKHLKNRTFIKHSLTYTVFYKIFSFLKDIYNSGSVAIKVVLIVIGYPILIMLTFFMFPITIGLAVWLAFKKVKEFNTIKEGVEKVKAGDLYHKIDIPGNGELARLATNINSITEGLNKAVANELKSERLKTELITNVSHDIRTPLTSIITYVDLLKKEDDESKIEEYIEIVDQKAQRLKILTEDLFEAAKASSGNIPVHYEKIDLISLITQGLGELDDKVQESGLEFKINPFEEKVYIEADGKLLWRAVENLLSNIFKYALPGSRVYIDVEDLGPDVILTIKNISAYELNISSEELMERFTRGDKSRTSQGSGLGLSIAKSLIESQKGKFNIEIDGDLFKAIIKIPKM